jgi:hypothetical protein
MTAAVIESASVKVRPDPSYLRSGFHQYSVPVSLEKIPNQGIHAIGTRGRRLAETYFEILPPFE